MQCNYLFYHLNTNKYDVKDIYILESYEKYLPTIGFELRMCSVPENCVILEHSAP